MRFLCSKGFAPERTDESPDAIQHGLTAAAVVRGVPVNASSTLSSFSATRRHLVKDSIEVSLRSPVMGASGIDRSVAARAASPRALLRSVIASLGLLLCLGVPARAFDGTQTPADDPSPVDARAD